MLPLVVVSLVDVVERNSVVLAWAIGAWLVVWIAKRALMSSH